ncbi:MAG TPA: CDP-alcohol phosphatidyltransferase family protein [Vicinamibacterales bacterium]|jgi:phosphatidylglycerophosphate synthase|nr:CDP-alcohol phosphatidyltransferase family protein [Vicinamibacterales bacterium]
MANALTAVRLLLALPLAILLASNDERAPYAAAAAIVIAIVSDLIDGPVARRRKTAGAFGGTFDHATDCVFVVSGLIGGVLRGVFPWLLPVLVVAAFTQYTADSYWFHRQGGLRGSRIGRYNGILYFFPLCGDTLVRLGLAFLRPAVTALCWVLVSSTCISIGERFMLARQARQTDRASRA